ncbi:MerR family DNA-binding transcriptional regulator [Streptomyces sp. NPDC097981]|uniref:MerR family DNA-binding transcriptional regulator n=1 Tax=Streptomyces sp. NPDC097981 TaxID=3155428 RepID=UPI00332F282F
MRRGREVRVSRRAAARARRSCGPVSAWRTHVPSEDRLDRGTLRERAQDTRPAELSERSGVSTATIKYCLREGLLPAGRRSARRRPSTTRATYAGCG